MFNPYQPYMNNQQIIRVNGEPGARAYQMMPNSSALLLDESAPRLFLASTDGAGYKSIAAYKLEPYEQPSEISLNSLVERIEKLEQEISNNAKSNTSNAKRKQITESE